MEEKQIRYLAKQMAYNVAVMKQRNEIMDKASWIMKMGIIMTGEDAELVISVLERELKRMRESKQ